MDRAGSNSMQQGNSVNEEHVRSPGSTKIALARKLLTVPSVSLTSRVANSHDSEGKLMLKLIRNRSPCALLSTMSSSLVSIARKLLSSWASRDIQSCWHKENFFWQPVHRALGHFMHAGHIFDEPCKLTAVRSTTMVNAATNDMPAPAKVASVRSLHTTEAKRDASGHTIDRICSQLNAIDILCTCLAEYG